MTHPAPAILRHAELVSASIAPHAQVLPDGSDLAAPYRDFAPTEHGERWTLKRVQGDGRNGLVLERQHP